MKSSSNATSAIMYRLIMLPTLAKTPNPLVYSMFSLIADVDLLRMLSTTK